jgi:hypothetical protein
LKARRHPTLAQAVQAVQRVKKLKKAPAASERLSADLGMQSMDFAEITIHLEALMGSELLSLGKGAIETVQDLTRLEF